MIKQKHETWNVELLLGRWNRIRINRRQYQRDQVWKEINKILLLDSILRGYDIGSFYLWERPDGFWELVDGQQRATTIHDFANGKICLCKSKAMPEFPGVDEEHCHYDTLPANLRNQFNDYNLRVIVIDKDVSQSEVQDQYIRCQYGIDLNSAEERHALTGTLRDFVADAVQKWPIFAEKDYLVLKNKRKQYDTICARAISCEMAEGPANCMPAELTKMYETHQTIEVFDPEGLVAKRVQKVFNFIYDCCDSGLPCLWDTSFFLSTYWLASQLMNQYVNEELAKVFQDFIVKFNDEVHKVNDDIKNQRPIEESRQKYTTFSHFQRRGAEGRKAIQARHDLLMETFQQEYPTLPKKDPQRNFTEDQRVVIYNRDKGVSQKSGKEVPFTEFHADHVVPHSKGGQTVVENGQLLSALENMSKGNRET